MITDDLGIIPNFYLHKVNDVNPASIVQLSTKSSELPVYPLSGQIAIDYKDFYTFKSNWDANYFEKYFEKGTKEEKAGTRSVIEKRSFFGSKIMKIEDSITIETFDAILKLKKETEEKSLGNLAKNVAFKQVKAIRYTIKNQGVCPEWHLGAGNPTWIFLDELIFD